MSKSQASAEYQRLFHLGTKVPMIAQCPENDKSSVTSRSRVLQINGYDFFQTSNCQCLNALVDDIVIYLSAYQLQLADEKKGQT
jgi:hypothetical protein